MGRNAAPAAPGFDQFYRSNVRALVALGWSLTGSPDVAADLAQYALSEAASSWSRIASLERPDLWVRRVVVNRAATHFRSLERQRQTLVALGPAGTTDALELSEATEEFLRLARTLPPLQMRAVVLHYLEDRPVAEIAQILEVTDGTVKTSLHRGRASLAALLRAEGEVPDDGGDRHGDPRRSISDETGGPT